MAVYIAVMCEHRLARGETGTVLVLSATRAQARTVFKYCTGFLESAPLLAREVASITQDEIRLRSGVEISTHVNSFRSVRRRTMLACIFDEIAFWSDEAAPIRTGKSIAPCCRRWRRARWPFNRHFDALPQGWAVA